jgi:hypothetical protein
MPRPGLYGDGIEGWVPFVDGGSDGVALEAIDDEFFDLHLRDEEGAFESWCEGCLLGIHALLCLRAGNSCDQNCAGNPSNHLPLDETASQSTCTEIRSVGSRTLL